MKKTFLSLAGLFLFTVIFAQAPLGTWTSYLPYNNALNLAVAGQRVFCSTTGGMFYYDQRDNSVEKFSRENGLSDFEISALGYSPENDLLLIAYSNANLDFIQGKEIYNLPDIKRKQILGDKRIYDIHFNGDYVYLACGFGIVKVDLKKKEIKETYFIGDGGSPLKVNSLTSFGSYLYAATDIGLFRGSLNNVNLIDYSNWQKITGIPVSDYRFTSITASPDNIFVNMVSQDGARDMVYFFDGTDWQLFQNYESNIVSNLSINGTSLVVCAGRNVQVIEKSGNLKSDVETGHPQSAILSEDNTLWIADRGKGLVRSLPGEDLANFYPNGPFDLNVAALQDVNGKLVGVAGGYKSGLENQYRPAYIYRYKDKHWNNWVSGEYRDPVAIAIDRDNTTHYFVATWGYGLLEFENDKFLKAYSKDNSSLQSIIPGENLLRLGGLGYDSQKNLWVPNSGVSRPLSVLKNDGEWKSFDFGPDFSAPNITRILVTNDDNIWMILPGGNGLFVYDYNGTIDNEDDDQYRQLSVVDKNGNVLTNTIEALAQDRQGAIWLGTNKGVLVYYSPSRVFEDDLFYANQVLVPRNDTSGYGDLLLGTETVTAIAIDGGNRKWLGTKNGGVFLVAEDGKKQIHAFNTDNSPLLSNSITDIAIDDKTGEVFFGTFNGIISYISDATGPDQTFNDVYVFPNPVRPDYQGDIVINGLIENTYVKITDLNGNLVYETMSQGGRAVWNGNNLQGDRVSTGIYLVFCTNEDGSQTHVTKLMFIH